MRTVKFVLGSLCILIIPLFAELFDVAGWDWKAGDFAIIAVLLIGLGAALAYATGPRTMKQRFIGGGAVLMILALYVHLAVGIVDTWPLAGS